MKHRCPQCGTEFDSDNVQKIYCSAKCVKAAFYKRKKTTYHRICKICGKEFDTGDSRKIYCSRECCIAAYYAGVSAKKPVYHKICKFCGQEFATTKSRKNYCSEECRTRWRRKNVKPLKKKLLRDLKKTTYHRICKFCGKEFDTSDGRKIYCSRECRIAADYAKKPVYHRICKFCGKEFDTGDSRKIYCNEECYRNAYKPQHGKISRVCKFCGKEFVTTDSRKVYCSKDCCTNSYNLQRKKPYRFCKVCGEKFPAAPVNLYGSCCSAECLAKYKKRKELPPKKCVVCGKEFIPYRTSQKCCGTTCSRLKYRQAFRLKRKAEKIESLMVENEKRRAETFEKITTPKVELPSSGSPMKDAARRYNAKMKILEERKQAELERKRAQIRNRPLREIQCPVVDVEEFEGTLGLAEDFKPAEKLRRTTKAKPRNELERRMAEAQECGLSYGQYIANLKMGKTFEEMKACNVKISTVQNENPALWWLNL